jgi:hypothetical protein
MKRQKVLGSDFIAEYAHSQCSAKQRRILARIAHARNKRLGTMKDAVKATGHRELDKQFGLPDKLKLLRG